MTTRILIVDDEQTLREALVERLSREGYEMFAADGVAPALAMAEERDFGIVVCDIRLPDGSGIDLMRRMSGRSPDTFFIVMTAYAEVEDAVAALRLGAYDFLVKTFSAEELVERLAHLAQYRDALSENRLLRKLLHQQAGLHDIVGASPQMQAVFRLVRKVASTPTTVLISGESGTGKELVARAIHFGGNRADEPFMAVDCAAIPDTLLESELFGHTKGAFTGADRDKEGLFVLARKGTLLLDEIGEVPLHLQVKLLRAIEQKQVMPIGRRQAVPVHARIVAATNRDLGREVEAGRFRADLFYRLNVIQLHLPPLRDRFEDIPALVDHFLRRFNTVLHKSFAGVETAAMRALMGYSWKGNVRELENVIERAMIVGEDSTITLADLPANIADEAQAEHDDAQGSLAQALQDFEGRYLRKVLEDVGYDSRQACARLGIARSTLFEKTRALGVSLRRNSPDSQTL